MRYSPITVQEILDDLLKRIRILELKPGSMISENEMAVQYNVSRSAIRTVFSKLEQLKLISRYPQIGTFISPFDLQLIKRILYLRYLVEKDALEKLIDQKDIDVIISGLEDNIKKQESMKNTIEYESDLQPVDEEFHRIIIEAVGLEDIMEILKNGSIHVKRWRNFDVLARNKIPLMIDQHKEIVAGLKERDIHRCKKAMSEHLMSVDDQDFLEDMKSRFPDYFS
jgi:DNA-binding GntR family transcriptional regulator